MAGTALENFTDFVKATGPAYFTSAEQFLNEAVNQTYALPRFLKGKGYDKVIQGGKTIKDDVMFDEANTYQRYKPNAEFTWQQPQVMVEQEINWRFSLDHMSWTDQEIELNMDDGYTRAHSKVQYKRMRKKIEQRMWTSMLNGMEKDLWQTPHTAAQEAEMEQSDGLEAYSMGAFITEDTTNWHPAGWTTIMGIDPANESRWRNQVSLYNFDDPYTLGPLDAGSLIQAFDDMWLKVHFVPPQFHQEHFESINMQAFRQGIFCSRAGLNLYKTALREENDSLVSKQDAAYSSVKYSGVDLVYIAQLDAGRTDGASAIYDHDGTAAYDEAGNDSTGTADTTARDGRRYWFINGNYLTPVFHRRRYFYKKKPYTLEKQPFTTVCPVDCWNNNFCHSRQRQGIIAPFA
jgi:hypothetical protein